MEIQYTKEELRQLLAQKPKRKSSYNEEIGYILSHKHVVEGKSCREIEKEVGINYRTINRWITKYLEV